MFLYKNSSKNFIDDVNNNSISTQLFTNFLNYYRRKPSSGEVTAWINSLQFVKNELSANNLLDVWIMIEYELPYSSGRIDCIFFGSGVDNSKNVIVMELKQWSNVNLIYTGDDINGNVLTYVGGAEREEPHPSEQISGYYYYLKDFMDIFSNGINLYGCAYCHNYSSDSLLDNYFDDLLLKFPLFTKNDFTKLGTYLKDRLANGNSLDVFSRFTHSNIKPSKKLVEYTSKILENQKIFTLLDDQITANNTVISNAKKASKLKNKAVIIVSGGPGTGKSVIALNAMAELLSQGLKVYHATGSKSFTSSLQKIVGSRAKNLFTYFNSFSNTKNNEIDVLIADEAHRLRISSNNRFTKKEKRSTIPQIEELINVAKVSVFFIDEYQVVRPQEVGTISMIENTAKKYNANVYKYELKTEFRCGGSDGYLNWIDNLLEVRDTQNKILTPVDKMQFEIMDSPEKLRDKIIGLNNKNPNSARMVTGFCWPWSDPSNDGTLKDDIIIGNFRATWELKDTNIKFTSRPKTSKWYLWPIDPECVYQVGSIYTIQGFEFDYIGLIWGNDFVYDNSKQKFVGKSENSADPIIKRDRNFTEHVRNIYRTLLTRARYGVFVYFVDKDTEEFVKSMIYK